MDKITQKTDAQRLESIMEEQAAQSAVAAPTTTLDVFQGPTTQHECPFPPLQGVPQHPAQAQPPFAPSRFVLQLPQRYAASPTGLRSEAARARPPEGLERKALPAGTALTRSDFQQQHVVEHIGQEIARLHSLAKQSPAQGDLYCIRDALGRIDNVSSDPRKAQLSRFDGVEVRRIVEELGRELAQAAPTRLLVDYNCYPAAMTLEGPSRALRVQADHSGSDYHAFFEPLARLAYTARLDPQRAETLLQSYTLHRSGRLASEAESQAMHQACYVLDLTYYHYFLDISAQPPESGSEKGLARSQALQAARALLPRLDAAQEVLGRPEWYLREVERA